MSKNLNFKSWILNEFADFGFGTDYSTKIQGGTSVMVGDSVFQPIQCYKIISELARMPALGPLEPRRSWSNIVEYGDTFGSLQVRVNPIGSLRVQIRQKILDRNGEPTWILKKAIPLCDYKDLGKEESIAQNIYDALNKVSLEEVMTYDKDYNKLEDLANSLWIGMKKNHPSYIMFPFSFRKQDENLYKFVFEMKGHGIGTPSQNSTGRTEQFNVDLMWVPKKGLLRCWGYDISSNINRHQWQVSLSEWDDYFSPHDSKSNIIMNILSTFMQY